ncbi:MAG: C-terminal helicase domain-containing protein, partial [Prochloraceae cyanobacterium]
KKRALELDRLRSAKQWKQFITLSKSFDNVPFAYPITTHKAQGSTIDYVFLDLRDISRCRDLQKILYTGLTRCKKKTFVSF